MRARGRRGLVAGAAALLLLALAGAAAPLLAPDPYATDLGARLAAPHVVVWPGLALALTVLALQLVGDGLRDALDVRSPRQQIVTT